MSDEQVSPEWPTATYRSPLAAVVHEGVQAMHRLGLVDVTTLREFDRRCLSGGEQD